MRAIYKADTSTNMFMTTGQEYELWDVTPEDKTDFVFKVAGIPGNFIYADKAGFENEWDVTDADNSTPIAT